MRKGFLGSLATLLAGAGVSLGQAPAPAASAQPAPALLASPLSAPAPQTIDLSTHSTLDAACATSCCEERTRFWGSAEYLLWWFRDAPVPVPLVTLGNAADALPGVPGQPGTSTLFGGSSRDLGTFSGGRLTAGSWLNCEQTVGFEVSGFLLEQRAALFGVTSDAAGSPFIGRPVFDLATNAVFPFSTTFPGSLSGGDTISVTSQFWGAEANGLFSPFTGGESWQASMLAGFRYLDLDEAINISETSVALGNFDLGFLGVGAPAGSVVNARDRFQTRNQFYGGQFGARGTYEFGAVYGMLGVKVGLGSTHQVANVSGASTLSGPGLLPSSASGGVLAVPGNSGRFTNDTFSVVPEVEARIGVRFTRNIGAFVGYNFLYWNNVLRPGEQIPTNGSLAVTNRAQIPSSGAFGLPAPTGPATVLQQTDFWAQGVNFGVEFRY